MFFIAPPDPGCTRRRLPTPTPGAQPRLSATAAARALIERLQATHGAVMFHQSGGSEDTSTPMCFVQGDFPLVEIDVLLGEIDGAPFYMSHGQYRSAEWLDVTLDAVPGRAGVFSLERPTGMRFTTVSRPSHSRLAKAAIDRIAGNAQAACNG